MKGWGNQKGFTLLEVLIASSVFVIVLFAVYVAYESSRATFIRGQNKVEVQQTARVAMEMTASPISTVRGASRLPAIEPQMMRIGMLAAVAVANIPPACASE